MKTFSFFFLAALLFSHGGTLAGIIFSDDFSSPSPGSTVSSDKWTAGTGSFRIRDQNTSTVFGTPARFGELNGTNVRWAAQASVPANSVVTLQFDFAEPSGSQQALLFGFGKSNDLNSAHAGLALSLDDGVLRAGPNTSGPVKPYTVGSAYRISVIFNRSGSTLNYAFQGAQSVTPGKADVWLQSLPNGTAFKAGTYRSTANTKAVNQFLFRTSSATPGNTIYVDNVAIHNTLALPGSWQPGSPWRSALYPESWTPPGPQTDFYTAAFLQDFSHAGYNRGETDLPQITGPEWVVTNAPFNADPTGGADSTAAIQAAINAASAAGGGVVRLPAGTYRVRPQGTNSYALRISASGVVLRGAGAANTFLFNDNPSMRQKQVIQVLGPAAAGALAAGSPTTLLTADLSGPATVLPVASVAGFAIGDWVTVRADTTEAWIAEHQASDIWSGSGSVLGGFAYRRQIVAVNAGAKTLTIDIPTRYALKTRDNARVIRASHSGVHGVGLEDFSIGMAQRSGNTGWEAADYENSAANAWHVHSSNAILINCVRDSWVRRVESYQPPGNSSTAHLLSNGLVLDDAWRITVADCHFQRPQYGGGGGNGYMYLLLDASDCLVIQSRATFSRHGLVFSSMRSSGNVFHRCIDTDTGRQTGGSGSQSTDGNSSDHHMMFSHSNLIDACTANSSFFAAAYRPHGGGVQHGITAAHSVYWNTLGSGSGSAVVQTEQARYGYAIGTRGSRNGVGRPTGGGSRMNPADWIEGQGLGDTLVPQSLYESQVQRRRPPTTPPAAPVLTAARSILLHDGVSYEITMPPGSSAGVETRRGRGDTGNQYTIVMRFAQDLASGAANVSMGTASVSSSQVSPGDPKELVVTLDGVANAQIIEILASVTTTDGGSGAGKIFAGFLLGDANGDGAVNMADVGLANAQKNKPVSTSNLRCDVNCDGRIDVLDVSLIRDKSPSNLSR